MGAIPGTVLVIDTATNTVVATVPVGTFPVGVAVTPDGTLAYVTNDTAPGTVSVIDAVTNTVVATVAAGINPFAVAVTPDGKHVYVTNLVSNTVSVIDTASNMVVATVPVGTFPDGVAVTPDGKHAYVANDIFPGTVSVIDTATNTVAATITVGNAPHGVAVTPDGKHAYVASGFDGTVSVIATASNTVVATVRVGNQAIGVTVTPDGKHAYITNLNLFGRGAVSSSGTVSVIDTASNTVVATVPVGPFPVAVAVTPDGKHAYVANHSSTVPVIDTASNTVVATVPVGSGSSGVGIMPPPVGVPFLAFSAKLEIDLDRKPNKDTFELQSSFTLSSTASINPVTEAVKLQVGTFTTTIPPGAFKKHENEDEDEEEHEREHEREHEHEHEDGVFTFHGVIDGVRLHALIKRTGTLRYAFDAEARHANLTGTKNPVPVMLTIGDDSGTTSVKARISHSGEEMHMGGIGGNN